MLESSSRYGRRSSGPKNQVRNSRSPSSSADSANSAGSARTAPTSTWERINGGHSADGGSLVICARSAG